VPGPPSDGTPTRERVLRRSASAPRYRGPSGGERGSNGGERGADGGEGGPGGGERGAGRGDAWGDCSQTESSVADEAFGSFLVRLADDARRRSDAKLRRELETSMAAEERRQVIIVIILLCVYVYMCACVCVYIDMCV